MGRIEFVGIINNFLDTEIEEKTIIPENAHHIDDGSWIDISNPVNWLIFAVPIFVIILILMFFKQRKNGIFNKEIKQEYIENNKIEDKKKKIIVRLKQFFAIFIGFWIIALLIVPIHEILHCIAGVLFGLNMKFGIDPQTFIGFAYTKDPLSKVQFLVMSLTPLVILGIIPLIILFVKYPKEKMEYKRALKYWILTCFIGTMIMTCAPDMLQSFNFIRNIPNKAVLVEDYWYIPGESSNELDLETEIESPNIIETTTPNNTTEAKDLNESNNTVTNNTNKSFTNEQVKSSLSNYLELLSYANCDSILDILTQKGELNYDNNKDTFIDNNSKVKTNVKFYNYKNVMLKYVSEEEFEKNWSSTLYFSESSDGYIIKVQGGGSRCVYTVESVTKNDENTYSALISSTVEDDITTKETDNITFTIKSYKDNCVINSIQGI